MEQILKWWPVLVVILNVLGMWLLWSVGRALVTKSEFEDYSRRNAGERREEIEVIHKRIDAVDERLGNHEREQTRLLEKLASFPTKDQLASLAREVSEVRGDVKGMKDTTDRIDHGLGLLMEHHLNLVKPKGS